MIREAFMLWWSSISQSPSIWMGISALLIAWSISLYKLLARMRGVLVRGLYAGLSLSALLAFVIFLLPPALQSPSGNAFFVTPGVETDQLDAIAVRDDVYVFAEAWASPAVRTMIDERRRNASSGRTIRIQALGDMGAFSTVPDNIRVLGAGLDDEQWWRSGFAGRVVFDAPAFTPFIERADHARQLLLGSALSLSVRVAALDTRRDYSLLLVDESDALLSQSPVAADASEALLLAAGLAPGRHVLQLQLHSQRNGADSEQLDQVPIAVEVVRGAEARILLLQSAPGFEWRGIHRWLDEARTPLSARIAVSADRYRQRFVSMAEQPLSPVTMALLSEFDLVIADAAFLSKLSSAEIEALMSSEHGAGVLLLLRDNADVKALPSALSTPLQIGAEDEVIYRLPGMGSALESSLSRLPVTLQQNTTQALLNDAQGRAVAARFSGTPHVAVSLIRDSYRLVGAGLAERHAVLWSELVRKLSRPIPQAGVRFSPQFSRINERLRLCVSASGGISQLQISAPGSDSYDLPLKTTAWLPGERCGWIWPAQQGWLKATIPASGQAAYQHVAAPDAWQSVSLWERSRASQARSSSSAAANGARAVVTAPVPIARDWPLVLFIICALLAWLVQRLAIREHSVT